MAIVSIPYGKSFQFFHPPDGAVVDWIDPAAENSTIPKPDGIIAAALDHPFGAQNLDVFRGARSVAIAINDKTRPVPHHLLLPSLLERLERLGLGRAVRFYIATGTHTPMPPEEFAAILPAEILARYPVVSHDCDDAANLVELGRTIRGTPVWANRDFVESECKIVVGNIEPHHFAGFSGGYKTAAIGLAGRATITANHIMLTESLSRMGEFDHNPLRQDIEEIGRLMGVHFALNVRLDATKRIQAAYFGHPPAVIAAGIPPVLAAAQAVFHAPYDIVITSPGGHPKDINFYQSQKAITPAGMLARDGGVVILVAACPEGSGSRAYEEFMQGVTSLDGVLEKFRRQGFRVGPHKALQVALVAQRVRIIVVSSMLDDLVRSLLLEPAPDLSAALAMAHWGLPAGTPRIAVLPHAINSIPVLLPAAGM